MTETKKTQLQSKLENMFVEADRARDIIAKEKQWSKAVDMLRGKQLPEGRPEWKPDAVLNQLRVLVERKTAMLTDTKPQFTVVPRNVTNNYADAAGMLKETAEAWWDDMDMDMSIARLIVFAQVFGSGVVSTTWNTKEKDVVMDVIDPRRFLIDPSIGHVTELSRAEYMIYEDFPSIAEMEMRFPKYKGQFKAFIPEVGEKQSWLQRLSNLFAKTRIADAAVPRTSVRHYWIKDYTVDSKEITRYSDTGEEQKTTIYERSYPGGRYIIWANGDVIVHDVKNPYMDFQAPFDMLDWYTDLDTIWGDGEIREHTSPQLLLNKLVEIVVENAMLMNNSIWVCDIDAVPDSGPYSWNQFTNRAGNIIRKRHGREVRRDAAPPIPADTQQFIAYLQKFIETRSGGMEGSVTGGSVGQIQSGLGVEQLQMAATALIRLKARSLESLIQRVGQKFISRVFQFYTNDRIFARFGPGAEYEQYIFLRQKLKDCLGAVSLEDAQRDFRFKVAPGSSLAMSKIQRALVASQLFQMGIIDREEVMKAVEWPDWKNVLQRTMDSQEQGLEGGAGGMKRGRVQRPSQYTGSAVDRQRAISGRV
jgi:hypothetical protein